MNIQGRRVSQARTRKMQAARRALCSSETAVDYTALYPRRYSHCLKSANAGINSLAFFLSLRHEYSLLSDLK
jgi:hypothetical protein